MKHGKKLQRWMKKLLESKGLNPENWLYIKNTSKELVVQKRNTERIRAISLVD
jgi:hypothetical protein